MPARPASSASTIPTALSSASARAGATSSSPSGSSMRILRGLASYPPDLRPCVTALGAFDGIHLGHALLITTAVERGRALGLPSVVCTFDPHPASVLWPERAPRPIATLDENLQRMDGLG